MVPIIHTVFGDTRYASRLERLLDAQDEPEQFQILMEEFILLELIDIAQQLMSKALGQHTADELRLIQILAQRGGELEIVSLLRVASRMGEEHD